jgi:hypothetical protein
VRTFADYTQFNAQHPDVLIPKAKKPMPFPLENFDQDVAETFARVSDLMGKIKAAKENPVNNTKARQSRLDSLEYKIKTCLHLLKATSSQVQDLWI